MMKPGRRACVIGWPIAHSRSPLIHGYWLNRYGIDGSYSKVPVPVEDLPAFLASLETQGYAGCNVTVPHKEAAYAAASVKHPSAIAVEAANTLWLDDGVLNCANTDTYGFITNLKQSAPSWSAANSAALVLGAGGSARAVVYGLLQEGVREVRIANRNLERAQDVARHFGPAVRPYSWDGRNQFTGDVGLIVNTTTLGMNGAGDPGIDFAAVPSTAVVADLVYVPLQTAFLRAAAAAGLTTVGGLGMLLHQAVPGFEKWFGIRPEVTEDLVRLIERDVRGAEPSRV
jgi:shikimate dehydrogenase